MTITVWPVNAVAGAPEYSGKMARQTMAAGLYGATSARPLGARSGVRIGTPTDTVSVSGSTVTIKPHAGILDVQASAAAGPYWYAIDANETKTLDAAHATYARIDIITVRLDDPAESDGSSVPAVTVVYTAGTAAASPAVPSPTTSREMVLAEITVPASGGGSAVVSWTAPYAAAAGGIIPVRSTTERDALASAVAPTTDAPLYVHRKDATTGLNLEYTVDGTNWNVTDSRNPSAATSYTPTLTASGSNPTMGSGSAVSGKYWWTGNGMVRVQVIITFGSSGSAAGTGTYIVSLPVAADTGFHTVGSSPAAGHVVGGAVMWDNSLSAAVSGTVQMRTSSAVEVVCATGLVSASVPQTWANNDAISLWVEYRAA